MITNPFLNNCQFSNCSAVYISLAIMFLQYCLRTAVLPSNYLLYICSIPALYLPCISPVYWLLPLNTQGVSSRIFAFEKLFSFSRTHIKYTTFIYQLITMHWTSLFQLFSSGNRLELYSNLPPAPQVSLNKGKILLKTLEQLSIDNLTLMNNCIEYTKKSRTAGAELHSGVVERFLQWNYAIVIIYIIYLLLTSICWYLIYCTLF